jgi:HK97 family phage prohead protease
VTLEHKYLSAEALDGLQVPEVKLDQQGDLGIVEALVAVTGNLDSGGDIIAPGAFRATTKAPWILWGHKFDEATLIGRTMDWEELMPGDLRLPKELRSAGFGGLWVKAQINLDKSTGADAFADLKFHPDLGWSIGYRVEDFETPKSSEEVEAGVRRILKSVDVIEASPVIVGMNQLAGTLTVKSDTPTATTAHWTLPEYDWSRGATWTLTNGTTTTWNSKAPQAPVKPGSFEDIRRNLAAQVDAFFADEGGAMIVATYPDAVDVVYRDADGNEQEQRLSWEPSAEDGAGPGDVTVFEVIEADLDEDGVQAPGDDETPETGDRASEPEIAQEDSQGTPEVEDSGDEVDELTPADLLAFAALTAELDDLGIETEVADGQ